MVATQLFLGSAATLIASSTAFVAPMAVRSAAPASSSSALKMSAGSDYVATLPGAPFGDGKIFDPLNLSDGADPADIKKWREAEIKHGRVAMLASLGVLVAEQYHPLFMGPDYIGPAVDHFQEISAQYPEFWVFSLLGMAFIEYNTIMTAFETPSAVTGEGGLKEDYVPGDLGFDPLNLKPEDEAALDVMKTKELNNGRLAMIGIAGMLVQELINPADILG
ncbi:Light harvesting complex protein [Ectocarpus siliculosus]|uniref:Light harvesting complex protein n=1 Tax=Ectocarpus siliculosus TaxID=2880 RepID=D7G7Q6_ECTSI|nr:Light harvesting complex protein [Ectocarpus siliculosus]|eukprot:CBJ27787.1 Light harvesting complex protein [Ectocarpus siliculosus]